MRRLMADPVEIDRVLADGAERAAAVADPVVAETKRLVGFWSERLENNAVIPQLVRGTQARFR